MSLIFSILQYGLQQCAKTSTVS